MHHSALVSCAQVYARAYTHTHACRQSSRVRAYVSRTGRGIAEGPCPRLIERRRAQRPGLVLQIRRFASPRLAGEAERWEESGQHRESLASRSARKQCDARHTCCVTAAE
jgi:hypothetical protein